MAQAPTPGVGRRAEAAENASLVVHVRVRDEWYTVAHGALPMRERLLVRKETGLPIEHFFSAQDHIGEDSLCILVWIARRANGERTLTLDEAIESWPTDLDVDDLEMKVDEPDPEATDPQA